MLSISQGQVLNEETRQSHNHQDTSWGITQHCLVSLHKFRVRKDSPCRKETEKQKLRSPQYPTAHLTEVERLPSWLASGLGLSALLSEKCFSLSYPEVLWLAWFYLAGDPLPFLASWYWNPHQPLGKKEQGRVGENSVRGGVYTGQWYNPRQLCKHSTQAVVCAPTRCTQTRRLPEHSKTISEYLEPS